MVNQPTENNTPPQTSTSSKLNRKKLIVIILILLILIAAVGSIFAYNNHNKAKQELEQSYKPVDVTVKIDSIGFKPGEAVIKSGSTISWLNLDKTHHQIIVDSYSGSANYSAFSKSSELSQNDLYGLTFDFVGKYTYHDQLNPKLKGVIEVK